MQEPTRQLNIGSTQPPLSSARSIYVVAPVPPLPEASAARRRLRKRASLSLRTSGHAEPQAPVEPAISRSMGAALLKVCMPLALLQSRLVELGTCSREEADSGLHVVRLWSRSLISSNSWLKATLGSYSSLLFREVQNRASLKLTFFRSLSLTHTLSLYGIRRGSVGPLLKQSLSALSLFTSRSRCAMPSPLCRCLQRPLHSLRARAQGPQGPSKTGGRATCRGTTVRDVWVLRWRQPRLAGVSAPSFLPTFGTGLSQIRRRPAPSTLTRLTGVCSWFSR